jgi:hypothetical protein
MTDPVADPAPSSSRCPWCSTQVSPETVTCPTCGAALHEDAPAEIPGVTQIDPVATTAPATPRSRGLIGWLSGEYESTAAEGDRTSVEPPTEAVRQEMRRIEMDALKAEIEAEAAEQAAAAADGASPQRLARPPAPPRPAPPSDESET